MTNTPTTSASVTARLTDEEILKIACLVEATCRFHKTVAVLRDYVRLRKLANAVIDRIKRYHTNLENPMCAFNDIKCMVAEAEKGER